MQYKKCIKTGCKAEATQLIKLQITDERRIITTCCDAHTIYASELLNRYVTNETERTIFYDFTKGLPPRKSK